MPGSMGLIDHLMVGATPAMFATGSVLFTAALFGRADAGLWTAQALVRAGAGRCAASPPASRPPGCLSDRPQLVLPSELGARGSCGKSGRQSAEAPLRCS
jgi:hypothetical protein